MVGRIRQHLYVYTQPFMCKACMYRQSSVKKTHLNFKVKQLLNILGDVGNSVKGTVVTAPSLFLQHIVKKIT